jgi:MraZ protein
MFLGEHRHNLDAKNRLFIPTKYREQLDESFIIAKPARGNCLRISSIQQWNDYVDPMYDDMCDEENGPIIRMLHRLATEVTPDSQGRVVVSTDLLNLVGITKSVVIVGCGRYIELYSEEAHAEMLAQEKANMSEMLQSLSKIKR